MASDVQSLLFDRSLWTEGQARSWAKLHGYLVGRVEHTDRFWRFRQYDPRRGRYRTIPFGHATGIKAVLRWPGRHIEEAARDVADALDGGR